MALRQTMIPELEIKNLTVSLRGREILHGIDLEIRQGEMISLLGPSGCGKSTLLKTVAGLLEAQQGDIFIGGKSVLGIPTEKRGAVIVFQDLRLFPHLTVAGNIEFSLRLQGMSRVQRAEKISQLLEVVRLPGMEKRKVSELSGGQMQRVALARALAAQPKLLLLDEPFSSLDEELREGMCSFVQELHRKYNMTIVMVTHDKEEAMSMSDRIALMIDGRLVQVDTPQQIYRYPASKRISDYFGGCGYLYGRVEKERFFHPALNVPASGCADGSWAARILPGMIHLQEEGGWEVIQVRYQGESSLVSLKMGDTVLMARSSSPPKLGTQCGIEIDTKNLLLLPFNTNC